MTASTSQIAIIHTLKSKSGMDDEAYRDFLSANFRVRSSKQLTPAQAGAAIDRLKVMSGQGEPMAQGAVAGLDTPIGSKLRALWIAAHDLGLVRDRTDRAMLAFLQRQTKVSHTRFLKHPSDATAAIEALKSWMARDAGVAWPVSGAGVTAQKQAVIEAQWMRLIDIGEVQPFSRETTLRATGELGAYIYRVTSRNDWPSLNHDTSLFDRVQQALGKKLRGAMARRETAARTS